MFYYETGSNDTFEGTSGADTFFSSVGTDILKGLGGNDEFYINLPTPDSINTNDDQVTTIYGGNGTDSLYFDMHSGLRLVIEDGPGDWQVAHQWDPSGELAERTVWFKNIEHIYHN